MNYLQRAKELQADTVAARRFLHENAEVGLDLAKTQAFLTERLRAYGITPQPCGKSITALIGTGNPTILLRADMDALPMKEKSGLAFASKSDAAHTCGHDLHAAMLLTAARMLKENEASLAGGVRLLFQPAEETLEGARDAIKHGALASPPPSAALALHVAAGSTPPGSVFYHAGGVMMTSADRFRIEVRGKGGHGAYPNLAKDPIACAVRIHSALEALAAHEAVPDKLCVISICAFHAGSTANIIPDKAIMLGAMHADDPELRIYLLSRIKECTKGIAQAFGLHADTTMLASVPPLICDKTFSEQAVALADAIPSLSFHPGMKANASEDFAVIAEQIPSCMLYLSAGFPDARGDHTAHHPRVQFNEDVLPIGSAIYATVAEGWLEKMKR